MRTIGDLVYKVDKKTGTKKVIKCTVQDLFLIHQAKEEDEFSFSPIPINEEWMIKLGCDKQEIGYLKTGNILFWIDNNFNLWIQEFFKIKINFVHEFQGAYFALTGEDIKIEL